MLKSKLQRPSCYHPAQSSEMHLDVVTTPGTRSRPPQTNESESTCCWLRPMTSNCIFACKNLNLCYPIQVARASASMFAPSSVMPFFFRSSIERGGFLSKTWIGIEKKHSVNIPPCHTLRKKLVSWPFELAKVKTLKMNLMDAMFVSPYCPLTPWTSDPTFQITNIAPLSPSSLSAKQSSVMELLLSRAWPTTRQPATRIGWSKKRVNVCRIAGHRNHSYDPYATSLA